MDQTKLVSLEGKQHFKTTMYLALLSFFNKPLPSLQHPWLTLSFSYTLISKSACLLQWILQHRCLFPSKITSLDSNLSTLVLYLQTRTIKCTYPVFIHFWTELKVTILFFNLFNFPVCSIISNKKKNQTNRRTEWSKIKSYFTETIMNCKIRITISY